MVIKYDNIQKKCENSIKTRNGTHESKSFALKNY